VETISGFLVFVLGAAILWQGRHLSVGSLRTPGPGFFPTLIALTLMILSLFLILRRSSKGVEGASFARRSIIRMVSAFVALLGYFFFLEYLGFVISSFFLMGFFFLSIARQRWYVALPSAVVCIGLAYILFEVLLKSNLPKGLFGF
jgi:putative tricarboxylic transport membrane protein